MGEFYKITCKDCLEEKEIYLGIGMMQISYYAYFCPNCNQIKNYNSKYQRHTCSKCKTKLVKFDIKFNKQDARYVLTKKIKCPKCKSENVEVTQWGFWD